MDDALMACATVVGDNNTATTANAAAEQRQGRRIITVAPNYFEHRIMNMHYFVRTVSTILTNHHDKTITVSTALHSIFTYNCLPARL